MFNGNAAIFCDEFWKVEMLEKAFKAGELDCVGINGFANHEDWWEGYPGGIAFTNYTTWLSRSTLSSFPHPVYLFDEVDFRRYLPAEDIKQIEEELANQLPF